MGDVINFNMGGDTPEAFVADDTNQAKWAQPDREDHREAHGFIGALGEVYDDKEKAHLAGMLATPIDDDGHGLGDSRLFVKAVAKASRQFNAMLAKREGGTREDGQAQIKYNMPLDINQRYALQREAQRILETELMNARSEFIRRSGRPLPGWWR
jgi:GTPase